MHVAHVLPIAKALENVQCVVRIYTVHVDDASPTTIVSKAIHLARVELATFSVWG